VGSGQELGFGLSYFVVCGCSLCVLLFERKGCVWFFSKKAVKGREKRLSTKSDVFWFCVNPLSGCWLASVWKGFYCLSEI